MIELCKMRRLNVLCRVVNSSTYDLPVPMKFGRLSV